MARTPKAEPQHPPRQKSNEELGGSTEERDRHLRYAHEHLRRRSKGLVSITRCRSEVDWVIARAK
jgi:hypothetical protein